MRNLTSDMAAELQASHLEPAFLAELHFDSATTYIWTGLGQLTWGEKVFTGLGNLCGLSPINETQDLEAKGITVSLNGIPSSLISLALAERCRGRPFRLYLAMVNSTSSIGLEDGDGTVLTEGGGRILLENNLVSNPMRLFAGLMDTMEITLNGDKSDIALNVESSLIMGKRRKVRRYTDEDQRSIFPMDKGLSLINQLQDKELVW